MLKGKQMENTNRVFIEQEIAKLKELNEKYLGKCQQFRHQQERNFAENKEILKCRHCSAILTQWSNCQYCGTFTEIFEKYSKMLDRHNNKSIKIIVMEIDFEKKYNGGKKYKGF
jgi:hypothetical protein